MSKHKKSRSIDKKRSTSKHSKNSKSSSKSPNKLQDTEIPSPKPKQDINIEQKY